MPDGPAAYRRGNAVCGWHSPRCHDGEGACTPKSHQCNVSSVICSKSSPKDSPIHLLFISWNSQCIPGIAFWYYFCEALNIETSVLLLVYEKKGLGSEQTHRKEHSFKFFFFQRSQIRILEFWGEAKYWSSLAHSSCCSVVRQHALSCRGTSATGESRCHWNCAESARVFGSMVCVKWHPHESQDPGFTSRMLRCSKMVSVIPWSCGVNVVADGCKPSCP